MGRTMFQNRSDAGSQLASHLTHLVDERPIVLGLPRGGVVVAAEIASALSAPLDVLIVRKLGAPGRPELAIGAVTDTGTPQHVLNQDIIQSLGVDETYIQQQVKDQLAEVHHRQQIYRRGRSGIDTTDRTVIVVDDGIATGATMRAALTALKLSALKHLVLAVPVASPHALDTLQSSVDELVCLHSPIHFFAVGAFYSDFSQTSDDEVIMLLDKQ